MPPTVTQINVILANVGEAPISAIASPPQFVVKLAQNTWNEVEADVAKRFEFNPNSTYADTYGNYITIRAARLHNSRYIGDETLLQFSSKEELAALASAHRLYVQSNSSYSFASFPAEVKALGLDEYFFLQGNIEEKIGTIRLATELATTAKVKAETTLIGNQSTLVSNQALTEVQNALKVAADTGLITAQQALVAQQAITEVQNTLKTTAETSVLTAQASNVAKDTEVKDSQRLLLDQQKLTEVQNTIKVAADAGLVTAQQALVSQQALTEAQNVIKTQREAELLDTQETLVAQQKATEEQVTTKTQREAELLDAQETLVQKQILTEVQNALKVAGETGVLTSQQALVAQQALTEVQTTLKTIEEASVLGAQKLDIDASAALKVAQTALVENQADTELQNAIKTAQEAGLLSTQQALVAQQALTEVQETLKRTSERLNIEADTTLKGKQSSLVDKQVEDLDADITLKGQQGSNIAADTTLKGSQTSLVTNQAATEANNANKVLAEKNLLESQKTQLDVQTALQLTVEQTFYNNIVAGTQNSYQTYAGEFRMMGIKEADFQNLPAYKKVEMLKDADRLRTTTVAKLTGQYGPEYSGVSFQPLEAWYEPTKAVNNILTLIGEDRVDNVNDNALSTATFFTMDQINIDLQGRGWWFNKGIVEYKATFGQIISTNDLLPSSDRIVRDVLSVDANDPDLSVIISGYDSEEAKFIFDVEKNSAREFDGIIKFEVLYLVRYPELPQKFRDYLEVRTALVMSGTYPRSGFDYQRLQRMEKELEAYFRDRDTDEEDYNIFDNPHIAARTGVNRPYSIF